MQIIRILNTGDTNAFKKLRLQSLLQDPYSWHSSLDEENDKPDIFFENKIRYAQSFPIFGYYGFFNDKKLIAYAQFADNYYKKKKHIANIYDVLVSSGFRNQGVGQKLIEYIKAKAKSVGFIEQIHLKVNSKNLHAISFYEKIGFTRVAALPNSVKESDGSYQDEYEYVLYI